MYSNIIFHNNFPDKFFVDHTSETRIFVKIRSLVPATNATFLSLTFSTNNGSTYLSSNYLWSNFFYTSNANGSSIFDASDTNISLTNATLSSTANGLNAEIYLFGFAQSVVATLMGKGSMIDSGGFAHGMEIGGMNSGTTAVNAIKFAMSSGNIASGTISLYGMKI